jgi:hypothetical protein
MLSVIEIKIRISLLEAHSSKLRAGLTCFTCFVSFPLVLMRLNFEDHCTAHRLVELGTGSCIYARNTKLHVVGSDTSPAEYRKDFGVQLPPL